jgi:uncharacterized membrane protein YeaQ/YmgE (transglycosylase-associated protein family)
MNVALWLVGGGVVGWIAFSFLKFNSARGKMFSVLIGMGAGYLGGGALAPLLGAALSDPGSFNPLSLFMALAGSAACLIVCDMIYRRFGV